jgi:hypothetical protein
LRGAERGRIVAAMSAPDRYQSFRDFYPFYLTEHVNPTSRRLHVVGTGLVLALATAGLLRNRKLLLATPLAGYGFAWLGHFAFEKNRPATFKYPLWSLLGDFRMFFDVVTGRRRW